MKSFSTILITWFVCAVGVAMGMLVLWLLQARPQAAAASGADLRPLQARIASLQSELNASRAKIAALEASAAAARLAAGTQRFSGARPEAPAGPAGPKQPENQRLQAEGAPAPEPISLKPPDNGHLRGGSK